MNLSKTVSGAPNHYTILDNWHKKKLDTQPGQYVREMYTPLNPTFV